MDISNLIRNQRKNKKLTMEEVANFVGVSKTSVKRWEDGDTDNIKSGYIMKLASILDINPLILLGAEPVDTSEDNIVRLPIISKVACGKPVYCDDDIEGYEYHRKDQLPKGVPIDELVDVIASGNSMYPNILDGDIVTILKTPVLENGEVGLFSVNGEATIKRFRHMGDQYALIPDNSGEYDTLIISENADFRIIGKVVGLTRKL